MRNFLRFLHNGGEAFTDLFYVGTEESHGSVEKALELAGDYLKIQKFDILGNRNGVKVWVASKPVKNKYMEGSQKWPCIKTHRIIDGSDDTVIDILLDSSNLRQLNGKGSLGREDIEIVDESTKVCWNKVKLPILTKPHDFCTVIHTLKNPWEKDSTLILTMATTHPSAPVSNIYTRSYVLFGMSIITKSPQNHRKTDLTIISHLKYTKVLPHFIRKNAFYASSNFVNNLQLLTSNPNPSHNPN